MKWIEGGISFEGTVAEYKELHASGIPAPVRTRKGKSITVSNGDGTETTFDTLKDAALYISEKTGRFVSASHLGQMNGAKVSLASFAAGKEIPLFTPETPELPCVQSEDPAKEPAVIPEVYAESPAEPAPASANE
ncbi:MAG: hypothetical protein PUC15_08365 [Lentisphaeria bacterium]|nr:hypothetical protein [Lentisphaeria bacterium]